MLYILFFIQYTHSINFKFLSSFFRDYNLEDNCTWNTASEKIERRTPYMKEWGDGRHIATTAEEAEIIWQEVKVEEKKKRKIKEKHEEGNEYEKDDALLKYEKCDVTCNNTYDDHIMNKKANDKLHSANRNILFVLTRSLGLKNGNNKSILSSATLGFAAGTIFMALLQKIRQK